MKPTIQNCDNLVELMARAGAVLNRTNPVAARTMRAEALTAPLSRARTIIKKYVEIKK